MPSYVQRGGVAKTFTIYDRNSVPITQIIHNGTTVAPPPPYVGRWQKVLIYENEHAITPTAAEQLTLARGADFIVVQQVNAMDPTASTAQWTPAIINNMKAINPNLLVGVYINFGAINDIETNRLNALGTDIMAKDVNGAIIYNPTWKNYFLEPGKAATRAYMVAKVNRALGQSPYDFVFGDILGIPVEMTAPTAIAVPGSSPLRAYTAKELYEQRRQFANHVRNNLSRPVPVSGNGLKYGTYYAATSHQLFDTFAGPIPAELSGLATPGIGCDSCMSESFVRTSSSVVVRTGTAWAADLAMLIDATARGRQMVCISKNWATVLPSYYAAEQLYAFVTYMLGADGNHVFGLSLGKDYAGTLAVYPWLSSTDYGYPLTGVGAPGVISGAGYTISGGIYYREFSLSTAVLNPTTASWTGVVNGQSITLGVGRAAMVMK